MRKWFIFVLLFSLLVFPSTADAQGGIKLKSIHIELWSEYDQPSMLVIHEFIVDESTPLPADVTLRFPKDGNLTAVAYEENNSLISLPDFTGPKAQGDWQIVTLTVKSYTPHRIEYYEPLLRDGNQRSFVFRWFGDYDVNEFTVTTQIPADSTNIITDPASSQPVKSEDGLHLNNLITTSSLKMGQPKEFKLQYDRDATTVTNPSNSSNIQPAEPVGSSTEGRVSIDNLPWIIGGFGLALIGMALFFYWRSTQAPEQKSRRRRRSGQTEEVVEGQAYCQKCGARALASDRFCRTCGSKLRT